MFQCRTAVSSELHRDTALSYPDLKVDTGEWLLDPRLLNKKLDVKIIGTTDPPWRNGRYEKKVGFTMIRMPLKSVNDSVNVSMGYAQSRIYFRAYHLCPEITMEQEGPTPQTTPAASPICSTLGTRVVIIGVDLYGSVDLIGQYALIIHSPYQLEPGQSLVQVINSETKAGHLAYFNQSSLCRSLAPNM
jgi:hypothetical protein